MPRGRHRHSPPLHRLLPPSAIAGVSVVCALGPWVFSEATVVRALAAAAAATAVAGAVVMRRWDAQAGKQVAELTRARVGDEWRYEERVAELETDLEESRELRVKLEQRLRAKRAELAGLRNEHAALLRRYATAETERASALEGRRLLELESGAPEPGAAASSAPALPPARSAERAASAASDSGEPAESVESLASSGAVKGGPAVFSSEGAPLYRRALTALARFDREPQDAAAPEAEAEGDEPDAAGTAETAETAVGVAEAAEVAEVAESGVGRAAEASEPELSADPDADADADADVVAEVESGSVADGENVAHDAEPAPAVGQPPNGHFTVPTAVAVAPAPPARRPRVEGGFDFFGTQKETPKATLDSVQNEDLADVVGQEALAVHKAEAEAGFKPADERSRGVGQVIDLTAHDETEHIDLQGLRSAAS
ncbi:hypothetical protein ACF073_20335 [Streptomyces sp. NPDC015171]|uniref:hypothetical protein n=1 Tax=Streptomyces sp. NPDC015171 TaxID=3364945 RepID=UPI003702A564